MKLYAHPFSSYCQKVLIALYENGTSFEWCVLGGDQRIAAELGITTGRLFEAALIARATFFEASGNSVPPVHCSGPSSTTT